METGWKTTEYAGIPYRFRVWINPFRTFPHRLPKGCGKPVRILPQTQIRRFSPHSGGTVRICGKRKILYNSGKIRENEPKRKNRVWTTRANPQVSGRISKHFLRARPENQTGVPVRNLVISSTTGNDTQGRHSTLHNKMHFSTILPSLRLLLPLHSLNYTIYLYSNSV